MSHDQEKQSDATYSRPSLIADLRREMSNVAARWTVNDAILRPVPPFYPPLNSRCTVFVGDAMPSVVAVRISECLRKRSVAVEFDDESVRLVGGASGGCHIETCVVTKAVFLTSSFPFFHCFS